jgi:hypothetical protein
MKLLNLIKKLGFGCLLVFGMTFAFLSEASASIESVPTEATITDINTILYGAGTASWKLSWAGGNGTYSATFIHGDGSANYTYNGNGTYANHNHYYSKYADNVTKYYTTSLKVSSGGSTGSDSSYVSQYN